MATTLKSIDKAIADFTLNRDKLRDMAHNIAMMVFRHAAPKEVSADCAGSGDTTRALKLVKAMPKSWAEQMTVWFKEFTPIIVVSRNDKVGFDPKYLKANKEERLTWWKLEEANSTPWFDLSDEPEVKTAIMSLEDLIKMAMQLGKRIEKIASDEDDRRVMKPEDKASALAFARMLEGLKVERVKEEAPANSNDALEEEAA